MTRILITGSRDWTDVETIRRALAEYVAESIVVVMHGDCRGADKIAAAEARDLGFWDEPYPADWKTYGYRAGIIRNLRMLDMNPDVVLAFRLNESRGTTHTVNEARDRGIEVIVYDRVRTEA